MLTKNAANGKNPLILSSLESLGHDSLWCDDVHDPSPPAERVAIYGSQQGLRHGLEELVLILRAQCGQNTFMIG